MVFERFIRLAPFVNATKKNHVDVKFTIYGSFFLWCRQGKNVLRNDDLFNKNIFTISTIYKKNSE